MDFTNKHIKIVRTVLLTVVTLAIFVLSCYICINKLQPYVKNRTEKSNASESMKVHSNMENLVSKDAGIIFKTKYAKSGDFVTDKEEEAGLLSEKTKSELEGIYKDKGYKVQSMNSTQVVLVKELDKYSPNKYVLGIKDGYIAIYKTDKDGNMYIENEKRDITDIKTDRLKKADIDLLTKGDKYFQCNTREDAQARLEDYE